MKPKDLTTANKESSHRVKEQCCTCKQATKRDKARSLTMGDGAKLITEIIAKENCIGVLSVTVEDTEGNKYVLRRNEKQQNPTTTHVHTHARGKQKKNKDMKTKNNKESSYRVVEYGGLFKIERTYSLLTPRYNRWGCKADLLRDIKWSQIDKFGDNIFITDGVEVIGYNKPMKSFKTLQSALDKIAKLEKAKKKLKKQLATEPKYHYPTTTKEMPNKCKINTECCTCKQVTKPIMERKVTISDMGLF